MAQRIIVTGAGGLLGFHARALLHADNQGAAFRGEPQPWDIVPLFRQNFDNLDGLTAALRGADIVLHFAGVNRGSDDAVRQGNPDIARRLVAALEGAAATPALAYANSIHAGAASHYGQSKSEAADVLANWAAACGAPLIDVRIPHVFGEHSRPNYNSVTATFCDALVRGQTPTINREGMLELVHAGEVVETLLASASAAKAGTIRLRGRALSVGELFDTLTAFRDQYRANRFPRFDDVFSVALFNTYRSFEFPHAYPRPLTLHRDVRGELFEAVKGGSGGQTFCSWTDPGVERGHHFHRYKVERFLVLSGEADIAIRRLFDNTVHTFRVSGESPVIVDMPTLHTHSIVNRGEDRLLTLFWAHEEFDPDHPDTYREQVA